MMEGCYDCARAEWDAEGATCGINGLHVNRPSLGCNKRIPEKRMTNGDRIRQMTDEELADMLLLSTCYFGCNKCKHHGKCKGKSCTEAALEWLKQEVIEDAGTD